MKAVLQRVSNAKVEVDLKLISSINYGILIFIGVSVDDDIKDAKLLADKISDLRIFEDEKGKMNCSIRDIGGEILVVSNFTLYADCKKGRRPSFSNAAAAEKAKDIYIKFCKLIENKGIKKSRFGVFGADMKVSLTNDGPVTVIIDTKEI